MMSPPLSPAAPSPLDSPRAMNHTQDTMMDSHEAEFETAFSRIEQEAPKLITAPLPRRRRAVYGVSSLEAATGSPMDNTTTDDDGILKPSDFLADPMSQAQSQSLFASFEGDDDDHDGLLHENNANADGDLPLDEGFDLGLGIEAGGEGTDDGSTLDEDKSVSSEKKEAGNQSENDGDDHVKSRGRTKRSFSKEASTGDHESIDPTLALTEEQPDEQPQLPKSPTKAPEEQSSSDDVVKEQPSIDALIPSIDNLYVNAPDLQSVTVKDIMKALEAEFGLKFTKPTKNMVRDHLTALIGGHVQPSVPAPERDENSDEESQQDDGQESDAEASEYDDEDEVEQGEQGRSRRSSQKKSRTSSRVGKNKKKPSAIRIHAEMLRKRRIEELKVRNEEMQVQRSKEDQKRAELIAAKFDTDTDEIRLKRLDDRLDLLQKLNQKRSTVIGSVPSAKVETNEVKLEPDETPALASVPTEEADSDNVDSDDEFELEILPQGVSISSFSCQETSTALSILEKAVEAKPVAKSKESSVSWKPGPDKPLASPGKSLSARAALRMALLKKQRKAGNMWLARELGYKTEEEHLTDCKTVEDRKRALVLKKEEERMRANERQQLRERLLLEGETIGDAEDESDEASQANADGEEEIDEEMAMAQAIERELAANAAGSSDDEEEEESPMDTEPAIEDGSGDVKEAGLDSVANVESGTGDDNPLSSGNLISTVVAACATEKEDDHSDVHPPSLDEHDDDATECFDPPTLEPTVNDCQDITPPSEVVVNSADKPGDFAAASVDETPPEDSHMQGESEIPETTEEIAPQEDSEVPSPVDTVSKDQLEPSDDLKRAAQADADDTEKPNLPNKTPTETEESPSEPLAKKEKNAAWKAMLEKEAQKLKKLKGRKGGGLVEAEADEEEEEEGVTGLEDFGFSLHKKKKDDDDEDDPAADKLTEDDMKHVVDDVSDDEGDEEEGARVRMELQKKEEKERHKELIRRMRDGYDGRRGGIAGAGVGARGMHRFDQLVAADNRDDAKRLGLLNDDELDSDDEEDEMDDSKDPDEIEDETALLDKMLKDRFLNRSSEDQLEENFSDDEEEDEQGADEGKSYHKWCGVIWPQTVFQHTYYPQTLVQMAQRIRTMKRTRNRNVWRSDLPNEPGCSALLKRMATTKSFRRCVSSMKTKL
jgi:hypothetical protein